MTPKDDAQDVSNCSEEVPMSFSEWMNGIDVSASKVDISTEEAAWKKPSIYRVTSFARCHNPNAFTPQVISFGPFHHGAENLKATEVHKSRALEHFLHRAGKKSGPFLSKLRCILKQLQDSYQDLDEKWKEQPHEFLKMMLLDGCFMIEVLRLKETGSKDYALNDPVFSTQMMPLRMPYIKRDMLLLENQLPLLLLRALLEVEDRGRTDNEYINNLVLKFCGENLRATLLDLARHPLELYRMSMLHDHDNAHTAVNCERKRGTTSVTNNKEIENALELWDSGVHFKTKKKSGLTDINFNPKSGYLELPVIHVHDGTEHLLLNMVAYEQIHVGAGSQITSYVTFMDALIDTGEDVKLLQKKKVISNSLGSHKAVADLFNSLGKEVACDPNDALNVVRNQLSEHYKKRTRKWVASLRHQYFYNPWKVIAFVAASLAILFTFVQTLYSVLSFHTGK